MDYKDSDYVTRGRRQGRLKMSIVRKQEKEHERMSDRRRFAAAYSAIAGKLHRSALAYIYSVAPPFARHANGEPDWLRYRSDLHLAETLVELVGDADARKVAGLGFDYVASFKNYTKVVAVQGNIAAFPNTRLHLRTTRACQTDRGFMHLGFAVPHPMPMVADPGRGAALNLLLDDRTTVHGIPPLWSSDAAYMEAWENWTVDYHARRIEAYEACAFLCLLSLIPDVTNRAIVSAFPWIREVFESYGWPFDTFSLGTMRGGTHDLAEVVVDAPVSLNPSVSYPWMAADVLDFMQQLGEVRIRPILAKLRIALDAAHDRIEKAGSSVWMNKPQTLVMLSLEKHQESGSVQWTEPAWIYRYKAAMLGQRNTITAYFEEGREILTRIYGEDLHSHN